MTAPREDLSVYEKIARSKAGLAEVQREARLAAATRRAYGVLFGGLMGAAAAMVAPLVNGWILLPGVPVDYGRWDAAGTVAIAAAAGAILGAVAAWPAAAVWGALAGDLLVFGAGISFLERSRASSLALHVEVNPEFYALLLVIGVIFAVTPTLLLLWFFCDVQGERRREPPWSWKRLRLLVPLLAIAVCIGMTPLNPPRRHQALLRMDALIRAGRAAASPADLPGPLQDPARIGDFSSYARRAYRLRPSPDPALRAALDDHLSPYDQLILARFAGGESLACLFKDGVDLVYCRNFPGP